MRQYRGLTKDDKMVYGSLVKIYDRRYIARNPEISYSDDSTEIYCTIWGFIEVIPETVGQQVGLKDKNGNEIYDGDGIAFNVNKQFGTDNRYKGAVYFCEMRLAYCVKCLPAWDMPIYRNLRDIEIIPPKVKEKSK